MARRRMIDPNFWTSEDVSRLSILGRVLLLGMISIADDEGRGRANINYLKSTIFPYDDIRTADLEKALLDISRNISVVLYDVAHSKYYAFTNWKKWQRVDKPRPSIFPNPSDSKNDSENDSKNGSGLKEKKEKVREEEPPYSPPTGGEKEPFDVFWKAYPRKSGKGAAQKSFEKIDSSLYPSILAAVEAQKKCEQWKRDGGQYIPYPATWLNQRRWEDEITEREDAKNGQSRFSGVV